MNRMVFWAGKSLKSMKLLIESETFLVGLTARWQICVKFHRIQRNYSASFSDILQGVSQWGISAFHFSAFRIIFLVGKLLKLPSSHLLLLPFPVSGSTCQAVCGWTPGRGSSRAIPHVWGTQQWAQVGEPKFALSQPRVISEPGHHPPCQPWRSPTAQGGKSCTHSASHRIVWVINISFLTQLWRLIFPNPPGHGSCAWGWFIPLQQWQQSWHAAGD